MSARIHKDPEKMKVFSSMRMKGYSYRELAEMFGMNIANAKYYAKAAARHGFLDEKFLSYNRRIEIANIRRSLAKKYEDEYTGVEISKMLGCSKQRVSEYLNGR